MPKLPQNFIVLMGCIQLKPWQAVVIGKPQCQYKNSSYQAKTDTGRNHKNFVFSHNMFAIAVDKAVTKSSEA